MSTLFRKQSVPCPFSAFVETAISLPEFRCVFRMQGDLSKTFFPVAQSLAQAVRSLAQVAQSLAHAAQSWAHAAQSLAHITQSLAHITQSLAHAARSLAHAARSLAHTFQSSKNLKKSIYDAVRALLAAE